TLKKLKNPPLFYREGGGGNFFLKMPQNPLRASFWFFRVSFLIYNTFIINVKSTGIAAHIMVEL
ncbi:MAG: hypothetical protein ACI9S8_003028, partial [Chlamydiales bacterium]